MAKITDPDFLVRDVNLYFKTGSNASGSKTIQLTLSSSLTYDGTTLQAVYSKCKELWKSQDDLVKFPFPLIAITEKKFDLVNSWDWDDTTTKTLIRDGGWALKDATNTSLEEWMGVITLGTLGANDQVYYQQTGSAAAKNAVFTGSLNEAVKIYGGATYGGYDYRNYFKIFTREYAKTYGQADLSTVGETSVTYQTYAFPLQNATDVKITHADATVATGSNYTGITISYLTASIPKTIGASTYEFDIIIDGNNKTKEQIYERIQWMLRQNYNINSASAPESIGNVIGKTADEVLNFVGDTLYTQQGVFVDNILNTDINFYVFRDTGSVQHSYPYVAAGTINFSDTLRLDPSGSFKMFYTTVPSGSYGSSSAIIVNDKDGFPITGSTSGSAAYTFTYDYDFNAQGGRTPQTDAGVTVVAIGLTNAQYISTVGTIARTNANVFTLVSALERNYSNPV